MSVFKEGYEAVRTIQKNSRRVFTDACDHGAPIYVGGVLWNHIKTLIAYADDDERNMATEYPEGWSIDITLIDEWAVSDKRKTYDEAQDTFRVTYTRKKYYNVPTLTASFQEDVNGWVEIIKL